MRKLPRITSLRERRSTASAPAGGGINVASFATIVGLFITLSAALLYAIHSAYTGGYFRAYGIPLGLFDTPWHTAIYDGSLQSFSIAVITVVGLASNALLYFFLAVVMGLGGKSQIGRNADQLFQSATRKLRQVPKDKEALIFAMILLIGALLIALAYGVYIKLILFQAEKAGADLANNEIAMIRANNAPEMAAAHLKQLTVFYIEGTTLKVEEGISIDCQHNSSCAIRQAERTVIIPAKNILRIDVKSKPKLEP